jgi:hypothetical protein
MGYGNIKYLNNSANITLTNRKGSRAAGATKE